MHRLATTKLNRRTFLQMTGGIALAALSAGCVAPSTTEPQIPTTPSEPQRGGSLRIAFVDSVSSLDPAMIINTADFSYGYTVFDALIRRSDGEGTSLLPQLAESWEMSEDALSYTFYLRQDVTFHHGTPFTAKDVEFTVARLLDPALGLGSQPLFSSVDRTEIVDDYTIVVHLNRPSVTLPFVVSSPGTRILPHDRTEEQRNTEPSGTGPFRFVEHLPGERTLFARNDNYWDAGLPYLDELQFLEIPEIATQIAALTSGTVDAIAQLGIENLPVLGDTQGVQILESSQGTYPVFAMNVAAAPFDDVRVRQAFKHALDRNTLQQVVLQGYGTVLNDQPVMPVSPLWADTPALDYDVEKAKSLLAEAGYADGLEVTLPIAEVLPRIVDTAVVMQGMLKEVGVTLNLNRVPVGTYWSEHYMQAPFFVSYWPSASEPDIQLSLAFMTGSSSNESGWSDPRVDALINESRGEGDLTVRKELLAEIQQIISQDGGVIIPYLMPILSATRDNVHGFTPNLFIFSQFVWLDPQS
jgi:peptide/nickel transport system substrate-binding protein